MGEQTKIKWCDSTINFWSGCTKVSPGCANCYAEELAGRFGTFGKWGKGAKRKLHESAFKLAAKLNRKPWVCECGGASETKPSRASDCGWCEKCQTDTAQHRRRTFINSMADILDPEVPIEWLARTLDSIRVNDQMTYILCTKRPELWRQRMEAVLKTAEGIPTCVPSFYDWLGNWVGDNYTPPNIILLTSVENQEQADKRIPELLKIPAACRGLSLEPLLGPVELSKWLQPVPQLDWLIVGGES